MGFQGQPCAGPIRNAYSLIRLLSLHLAIVLVALVSNESEVRAEQIDCRGKRCLSSSEIKTKLRRAEKRLASRKRTTFQVEISPKKLNALISASANNSSKPVKIKLPTANGSVDIQLRPTDVVSKNYVALETSQSGIKILPTNFHTFNGKVNSKIKDDFLALTIFESSTGMARVEGLFKGRGKLYTIKSDTKYLLSEYKVNTRKLPLSSEPFEIREVRPSDLRAMMRQVPIDKVHHAKKVGHDNVRVARSAGSAPDGIVEAYIATDIDFSYLKHINSINNPAAANAKIISIINSINGIYTSQLGIKLKVSFQHAWTKPDPYGPGGDNLLHNFAQHWKENFENTIAYTSAHLFTSKSLGGGVIGLAYLSGACEGGIKYGASRYTDNSMAGPLFAHELGHNLGAEHDKDNARWIMYPYITTGQQSFSPESVTSMNGYVRSVYGRPGCLRLESDPLIAPPKVEIANFKNVIGKSGIDITFQFPENSSNISGISVFRSDSSSSVCSGTPIAQSVSKNSFFDSTAQVGKTYYYSVRAISWDNQLGDCSTPKSIQVSDSLPSITSFGPYLVNAKVGDTVEFKVETSSSNQNLVYEWMMYSLKNGVPRDPQRVENANGPVLTLTNVNASHNQKFFGVVVKLGSEGIASPLAFLKVEGGSNVTYKIEGSIQGDTSEVSGVAINGGALGSTITDSLGNFTFDLVPEGYDYIITPSKLGFKFDPPSVAGKMTANTKINFTQTKDTTSPIETVRIEGVVRLSNSAVGLPGIRVSSNHASVNSGYYNIGQPRYTDSNGRFVFDNVPKGVRYWIVVSGSDIYEIENGSYQGTADTNITLNVIAKINKFSIKGEVLSANLNAQGVAGVTIDAGVYGRFITDQFGAFKIEGIDANSTVTIRPTLQGYNFNPTQASIKVDRPETYLSFEAQQLINTDPDLECQKDFVQLLYNRMLFHSASNSTAETLARELKSGSLTRSQLFSDISASDEFQSSHLTPIRAYELLGARKGRKADIAGYRYWVDELKSGRANKLSMVNSFIRSQEYRSSFGNVNTEAATTYHFYLNSLWRTPTLEEVNYWQSRYQVGVKPEQAALAIAIDSAESRSTQNTFIKAQLFPLAIHNRNPIDDEIESLEQLLTGSTISQDQIVHAYLTSEDFNKSCSSSTATALQGDLDNNGILSRVELITWLRSVSSGTNQFSWQNPTNRYDVNNDGRVQQIDAQIIIDELNSTGPHILPAITQPPIYYYDVNGDGSVSSADSLAIINYLN